MHGEVAGKRITVVGARRSGLAAARLLSAKRARVFLTDEKQVPAEAIRVLEDADVRFEAGGHSDRALDADFLVVSPGVPSTSPLVLRAKERALGVYSEIEAASWFCRAPIVAVTGSNGKTTTTSLLGHVFRSSGTTTYVGGNIGNPFSDFADDVPGSAVVILEVSSFQLDHVDTFRPRVSVLLNVTPDHLDRYEDDFDKYVASKCRIFENQRDHDACVYNMDDAVLSDRARPLMEKRPALRRFAFSTDAEPECGGFRRGDDLIVRINYEEEVLMRVDELSLRGRHNIYNSLAAAVTARVMEVRSDVVRESLMSFEGVPHRLELVREVYGVRFVNDSKATNVNAVWYALESFDEPLVLIAGGRDKGNDYTTLKPLVRAKARAVVAIGESARKVAEELGAEASHCVEAETMEEAVHHARLFAEPGDVVLLSPACASFDMFENYEERGEIFKRVVYELE